MDDGRDLPRETLPESLCRWASRDFSAPCKMRSPPRGGIQEVEYGPLGRGQSAGEPVPRRWSSPRFVRHSGLADTAHGTDCRVEPLFMNVGSTGGNRHTCFAGRLLLRILRGAAGNYKSCSASGFVLSFQPPLLFEGSSKAEGLDVKKLNSRFPRACRRRRGWQPVPLVSSACLRSPHRQRADLRARRRHRW